MNCLLALVIIAQMEFFGVNQKLVYLIVDSCKNLNVFTKIICKRNVLMLTAPNK